MLSRTQQILNKLPVKKTVLVETPKSTTGSTQNYATKTAFKFKKSNSQAVKDLAADDSGKHTHLVKETCVQKDCDTKICPTLCDKFDSLETKGHFTHGPKAGKFSKCVSNVDANNTKEGQYYTKNCDKNKIVSGQKAVSYKTNKEIKPDSKMQQYLQKLEIADKFKDS